MVLIRRNRKIINAARKSVDTFSYLGAVEHIRRVLIEDDGLPVDVPGGGQGQAGDQEGDGGPHDGHCDLLDLG